MKENPVSVWITDKIHKSTMALGMHARGSLQKKMLMMWCTINQSFFKKKKKKKVAQTQRS